MQNPSSVWADQVVCSVKHPLREFLSSLMYLQRYFSVQQQS